VEGITEYDFANGLRVLLFPDNSKPKLTVNITYLVSSRHEGYGETPPPSASMSTRPLTFVKAGDFKKAGVWQ
jgi:hypothetical protein